MRAADPGRRGRQGRDPRRVAALRPDLGDGLGRGAVGTWNSRSSLGRALCGAGVKLIDVSSGALVPYAQDPGGPGFPGPPGRERSVARRGTGTGAVGMITDVHQANEIITSGAADLVFIGREMLRDPYWAIHAAQALHKDAPWPIPYGYAVEPRKG